MRLVLALTMLVPALAAQSINTARPRLFLTPAKLTELRAKMNGAPAERALFTSMKSFVDGSANSDYLMIYPAAMMYQLDKTAYSSYGQRACDSAYFQIHDPSGELFSADQWQNVSGQGRYTAWVVAVAYDLANDKCSTTQLSAFAAFMANYYAYHKDHYYGMETDGSGTHYAPRDNKFVGVLRNNAEMAIAIYDAGTHPEGATWLAEIGAVFNAAVVPYLTDPSAQPIYGNGFGGSTSEGSMYGPETQTEYGDLLDVLTTGTGTDFWALAPNFATDTLRYHIAISGPTTPGSFNGPRLPYGDDDEQGPNLYYQQYLAVLRVTDHLRLSGDFTNAGYGQWWIHNVFDYGSLHPSYGFCIDRFYYYAPFAAELGYAATAPDYLTPFMLVSRSDWTAGATWMSFMAMQQGADHEHGNAGTFQVYRRGTWLTMDPLVYMSNEPVGAGATGHNSPLLNFHGSGTALTGGSLDWARFSRTAGGYRGECSVSPGYCYAQADMSGVYRVRDSGQEETPDVQSATRDLLYLKPDVIVAADRFQYINGLAAMSISNLLAEAQPTVSGNRLTLPNGNQRLHVNIVRPLSPVIKAYADDKFRVMGALKVGNDEMELHLDGTLTWLLPLTLTLSGGTGQWAALNGTWTCTQWTYLNATVPGLPYRDGRAYNMERCRITSPGAFSGITTAWDFSQNIVSAQTKDWHYSGAIPYIPYHAQFSGNTYANAESHLMVIQAADDVDTPISVTDRGSASVDAAEFGTYVVASPNSATPAATLAYSYTAGGKTHYILGLTPNATYKVAGIGTGSISITGNGPGTAVTASGSGLLVFTDGQAGTPAITPPLSPASAVAGGPQFTLTVNGTGFVAPSASAGSVVQWTAGSIIVSLQTTFVSSTQLTAAVPASLIAAAGTVGVSVIQPNGLISGAVSFTIIPVSLSIAKTHTGNFTQGQNAATYTIGVSNTAAGPTSGTVTVTETVPSGLTLISMAGTGWTCAANACARSDALLGGASYPPITVTVNVAANATSPKVNQAGVSGGGSASASTTDSTTITSLSTGSTIQTNPAGRQFSVDGGTVQTAPQTLNLAAGTHSIAVAPTQAGGAGTQYVFTSWSDGGAATHNITVGSSAATYTATFKTQYQLTTAASPAAGGTVTPASGGFYDSGTAVPISASTNSGYSFPNWTGSVGSVNSASTTVTMAASETVTANFTFAGIPFFAGSVDGGFGTLYLQFPNGKIFGYYVFLSGGGMFHADLGYEAVIPGNGPEVYMWDMSSGDWWYTNASTFPYLYDFTLHAWIYYFPDTNKAGHYMTNPRWFANMTTGQVFTL